LEMTAHASLSRLRDLPQDRTTDISTLCGELWIFVCCIACRV
jgi:hypothetical protein